MPTPPNQDVRIEQLKEQIAKTTAAKAQDAALRPPPEKENASSLPSSKYRNRALRKKQLRHSRRLKP